VVSRISKILEHSKKIGSREVPHDFSTRGLQPNRFSKGSKPNFRI